MPLFETKKEKSTDWKWSFSDYPKDKNGLKVFSCFACAGGSTMGYKLAGCDVIGCLEIDKRMNDVYNTNHTPKHNYLMDIREFNKMSNDELPEELLNLDILDGSPPCTTFSMAGKREETWGKKKKFAEGQTEQILDELILEFAKTANKLKPKVVIMENVKGLIIGNAVRYYQDYLNTMKKYGYQSKGYLLKGEEMGVPQKRHRVFVISIRNDIDFDFDTLNMNFNYEPVLFGDIKDGETIDISHTLNYKRLCSANGTETRIVDITQREEGKLSGINLSIYWDNKIAGTLVSGGSYRGNDLTYTTKEDIRNIATFPQDYNFLGGNAHFMCGMSVPPIMIKRIMTRLLETDLFKYKDGGKKNK